MKVLTCVAHGNGLHELELPFVLRIELTRPTHPNVSAHVSGVSDNGPDDRRAAATRAGVWPGRPAHMERYPAAVTARRGKPAARHSLQ